MTKILVIHSQRHCVKSVQIRSFFWSVISYIWTEYRKIWTKETPYLDIFHAVRVKREIYEPKKEHFVRNYKGRERF